MVAHGIMFHHFHQPGQDGGQGSITAETLERMIGFLGHENILPAAEWYECAVKGTLRDNQLCLTFDDNLMCQYEVGVPVLKSLGLTGFFFIYSSVCEGNIEHLEIYREFRTKHFDSMEAFYAQFEQAVEGQMPELQLQQKMQGFRHEEYLASCSFYTPGDKRFRYIRDRVLGPESYHRVMEAMIAAKGLGKKDLAKNLWMDDARLHRLSEQGHMVGLHSYSHPTRMCDLPKEKQAEEYRKNFEHISRVTGAAPKAMSHPCGVYTAETLELLRGMGIKLGFCANMVEVKNRSELEFPRKDHADLIREITA